MSEPRAELQASAIKQQCKRLHLPTVGGQCVRLAGEAERERQGYLGYLEVLLQAELEEREQNTVARRIKEAHLPKAKTLEEFDFGEARAISATKIRELAEGGYIERSEPVVFIGECGTGKTHLLSGLCVAACRQRRRVRFTTAAGLVNELVEAKQQLQLGVPIATEQKTSLSPDFALWPLEIDGSPFGSDYRRFQGCTAAGFVARCPRFYLGTRNCEIQTKKLAWFDS